MQTPSHVSEKKRNKIRKHMIICNFACCGIKSFILLDNLIYALNWISMAYWYLSLQLSELKEKTMKHNIWNRK